MMSFVLKRDNRKEEFEVEKIKKVISWATKGLDANPLILESKFDEFICDGISTTDIQSNLIYHARILCVPEAPEWSVVAGRLATMLKWKSSHIFEKTFSYYMQEQIERGIYSHPGLKKWTKHEIKNLGDHIVQDRDLEYSYGAILTAHQKYLVDHECIQQMHMVNAMIIASVEDKEHRLKVTKKIYDALSLRKISLATPWLSNLRRNKNISSCFIIGVDDDLNSIFDNVKNAALISKNGGGLGIDLSRIRAKGATIDGRPGSSKGITSWAKIFNDVAVSVDQCLHPSTMIITKDGFKPIIDITSNDYVLNESGNFSRVERKKAYTEHAKKALSVKINHSIEPMIITSGHPIFSLTGITKEKPLNELTGTVSNIPTWRDIGNLEVGDFIGQVIPVYVKDYEELTNDICHTYGTILGDYSIFDSISDISFIKKYLYDINKIHVDFTHLPPSKQLRIIEGILSSVGTSYYAGKAYITISNRDIAEGIRYLLLRNKLPCKIDVTTNGYDLTIPINNNLAEILDYKQLPTPDWIEANGYIFSRIEEIKESDYTGDVYDLQVQKFPSYMTSSALVHNGGRRAGAFTVHVPIWHRDIEDFLEIQTENGDFRKKAFDIFPQVGLMDLYMKEVVKEDGGIWYTFCPHEVKKALDITLPGLFGKEFAIAYRKCITAYNQDKLKNVGVYTAKDLLKSIMRVQFETGLPYLIFLDRINETNPNSHMGYIPCANLCTESFSNVEPGKHAHTCNLCSVVVGRMETDQEVIDIAALCARILDNGIQLTKPPIQESLRHNETYRTIGIGILGLHDYVAKNDFTWDSFKEFTKLSELIEYGAVSESVKLAKDRGKYPVYEGSKWDTGELMEKFAKNSVCKDIVDWEKLAVKMKKHGIRNSQLTSPAPNTSTSIFMDATPGIMPSYAGFYNEDNKTGKFSVYGMYIKENPMSYEMTAARQDQKKLAKMVGALQLYIDTGCSAEYLFDQNREDFSAKSLFELIVAAWKEKTKAIYYIRSLKKGETIDNIIGGEAVCVGCSG